MKLLKKTTLFCAALLLCFGLSFAAVACVNNTVTSEPASSSDVSTEESSSEDSSSEEPLPPADYVYRIAVENEGGYGFRGIDVSLKNGDTVVATATTYSSGYAYFENTDEVTIPAGEYTISLENIPTGYSLVADSYKTIDLEGTDVTVQIRPNGLLSGTPATGELYQLGEVIHDAEMYDSDGELFKISAALAEKDLLVINFWATWCGPCKSEFPAMQNALIAYADSVDCIAISTTDTAGAVADFKSSNGYTFKMASAGAGNLAALFGGVSHVPRTVMIDRYGVVVFDHTGGINSPNEWLACFDIFLGKDYVPTVVANPEDIEPGGGADGNTPVLIKPNVEPIDEREIKAAFTDVNAFNFRYQEEKGLKEGMEGYDAYNWPWLIATEKAEDGSSVIYTTNKAVGGSWSILYTEYVPQAGDVLVFDYKVGSEGEADYFHLMIDGLSVKKISGNRTNEWNTYYYVFQDHEIGQTVQIAFAYIKDSETNNFDDTVYLKKLRVETKADIPPEAGSDAHIFRNAATVLNKDENATTQFKNYVDVVYNADDNYYHVGAEDGPILFANLWYASQWSNNSVWNLAYGGYCVVEGFNYGAAFETYAWEANQPTGNWGYTPVTPELRNLLEIMVEYVDAYQVWEGEYHENEWLEVCCYYEHFGDQPFEDPMKGITFNSAIEMNVGSNTVNVPYTINPRGFKYKFTPDTSGAYKVYSTGAYDTVVFLMGGTTENTMLGEWDDKVFAEVVEDANGVEVADGNFEFYYGFEAGKTYYLLFTTFLDQVATYNVEIEYLGASYTYLENAATLPYSTNLITNELFIPNAIEYAYSDPAVDYDKDGVADGDGYYHYLNADGSLGSIIYLDIDRPTSFNLKMSLYDAVRASRKIQDVTKRDFYINGTDYTEILMQYCFNAKPWYKDSSMQQYTFQPVNAELFDILRKLTMDTAYEGVGDSWLLLCYYEKTVGIID